MLDNIAAPYGSRQLCCTPARARRNHWWFFFNGIDIQGDSENYTIGFQYPFFLSDDDELMYAIAADFKRASLLGQRFPFSLGADDGETPFSACA